MQRAVGLLVDVDELAEDSDDLIARIQRDGADLDADPLTVLLEENGLRVGARGRAGDLLGEQLPRAEGLLGCADRRELPPFTSPTTLRPAGLTQRMIPYLSIT